MMIITMMILLRENETNHSNDNYKHDDNDDIEMKITLQKGGFFILIIIKEH